MSVFARMVCAVGVLFAMTAEAWAYGGPGAAITLIGSLIGVGLAIFASLFFVIAWPLRRMLKKRKTSGQAAQDEREAPEGAVTAVANTVEATASRPEER